MLAKGFWILDMLHQRTLYETRRSSFRRSRPGTIISIIHPVSRPENEIYSLARLLQKFPSLSRSTRVPSNTLSSLSHSCNPPRNFRYRNRHLRLSRRDQDTPLGCYYCLLKLLSIRINWNFWRTPSGEGAWWRERRRFGMTTIYVKRPHLSLRSPSETPYFLLLVIKHQREMFYKSVIQYGGGEVRAHYFVTLWQRFDRGWAGRCQGYWWGRATIIEYRDVVHSTLAVTTAWGIQAWKMSLTDTPRIVTEQWYSMNTISTATDDISWIRLVPLDRLDDDVANHVW